MSIGPFNKEDIENDKYEEHRSLRFALDTARTELRMSRMEILADFIHQVSLTGAVTVNPGTEQQYTYDFHGSPWLEREYVPKELYAQKIARIKEILSNE